MSEHEAWFERGPLKMGNKYELYTYITGHKESCLVTVVQLPLVLLHVKINVLASGR